MVLNLSKKSLLALLPYFIQASATVSGSSSGSGTTTRYWDCCKPSCAWSGKIDLASGATPVETCSIDDTPLSDDNATSGCDGGTAYTCSDNSPWAVSDDLAYGFAAVSISGGSEESWCCACYELTFTSTAIAGKKMIVQATSTGSDLSTNQFDINIPGGGVGIFNGCTAEWGAPSSGWGAQYGGVSLASACATFPTALQPGCEWRYDWFEGADNPTVDFVQVECPAALTAKTGCVRAGEDPTGSTSVSTDAGSSATSTAAASSSTVISSSSSTSVAAATTSSSSSSSVASVSPSSSTIVSSTAAAASTTAKSSTTAAAASTTAKSSTTAASQTSKSSSAAGVATSKTTFSKSKKPTSVASSAIEFSAATSSTLTTTSLPNTAAVFVQSPSKTTSVIMVTVTAKPGDVIPSGGSGDDFCEL